MSKIRDEVDAENFEEIRKEQKVVIKNFIRDHEKALKVLRVAEERLIKEFEKLEEVSNLNEDEFKDSKFYKPDVNPFFKTFHHNPFISGS